MQRRTTALAVAAGVLLVACTENPESENGAGVRADAPEAVTVDLLGPDGRQHGRIEVEETGDGTLVSVAAVRLPPGYHGFHVHGTGKCEPDSADPQKPSRTGDFLSAGGHLGGEEGDHGRHAGDLPGLYVTEEGVATLEFETDRFALADLQDEDGSAFVVHAEPDNLGHIPERYGPDAPDADTRATGDAGDRIACGVVRPA